MVSALDRKLLRDLWRLSGQMVTIAAVVACGIAAWISLRACELSLRGSMTAYYDHERFGDVFAHVERAPDALIPRLEAIAGVATLYTRVTTTVTLPIAGMTAPAIGEIVSLPADGVPRLNGLDLAAGRLPFPGRDDEAVLLTRFAALNDVEVGDQLPVIIAGRLREVRITGLGTSPEFVFASPPGANLLASDPDRFAVLWMDRAVVAAAFRMEGAFDDLVVRLQPGASVPEVCDAIDRLLERHGGFGALAREDHPSHKVLMQEFGQLGGMATVVPAIFLGVAAYLLNVVLSRLVALQRGEIAVMKAVGYGNAAIAWHFLKLVSAVVLIGAAAGVGLGVWLGRGLTWVYQGVFGFPVLEFHVPAHVVVTAIAVSLAAALLGSGASLWGAVRLAPAEAMRPPSPARYRRTVLDVVGDVLPVPARLVLREIARRPLRTALSCVGIGCAVGILVVGRYSTDAIDTVIAGQYERGQRDDIAVAFARPVPERAVRSLAHLPGVEQAEGIRQIGARVHAGPHHRDILVEGWPDGLALRRQIDNDGAVIPVPTGGILLSRALAEILDLRAGQIVDVEILSGDRPVRRLEIAGFVDDMIGLQGTMRLAELRDTLREGPVVTQALLRVEPRARADVIRRVSEMPMVSDTSLHDALIQRFRRETDAWMTTMTALFTGFAAVIAIGIVYNNARIALETRNRDLASLRVLGFTRGEITTLLFGEMAVQVALAIPLGLWFGRLMSWAVASTIDPETVRFPDITTARTQAFAIVVVLASAVLSGALIRRKLDRLDLIGVLKTRE